MDLQTIKVSIDIVDVISLGAVGTIVSAFVQWVKTKYGTDATTSKAIVVALSVAVGAVYWFLKDTALWVNIVGILTIASTVFALFWNGSKSESKY